MLSSNPFCNRVKLSCDHSELAVHIKRFYADLIAAHLVISIRLNGIILEQAENPVRGAVRQILAEISGAPPTHLTYPARFVPETEFHRLKVVNLANQLFAAQE